MRADSGIVTLDAIDGATAFIGPADGSAPATETGWIVATTGMGPGEDHEAITANWATGFQSFLHGKIDVYLDGCLGACRQVFRISETEDMRFIGPEDWSEDPVATFLGKFRNLADVPVGVYAREVDESPVISHDTNVGIGVRTDLDA